MPGPAGRPTPAASVGSRRVTAVLQAPRAVPGSPRQARPYAPGPARAVRGGLRRRRPPAAVRPGLAQQRRRRLPAAGAGDRARRPVPRRARRRPRRTSRGSSSSATSGSSPSTSRWCRRCSPLGLRDDRQRRARARAARRAGARCSPSALAREVGLDRRTGVQAAALVSLSPLMLVHTALPLSYVPFVVLVVHLLAARSCGSACAAPGRAPRRCSGCPGVAAACARPLDAVLLLAPGLVWIARKRRDDLARLARRAGPRRAAAARRGRRVQHGRQRRAVGAAVLLLEPDDALGYGVRRLLPEDVGTSFYPPQGVQALVVHFGVGSLSWYALGALLVPAAVVSWRRPSTSEATRVLLVGVLVLLVAYTAFWGPYNYTFLWKQGARVMGPVYGVALLVPVVLAGLPVLKEWLAARRLRARPGRRRRPRRGRPARRGRGVRDRRRAAHGRPAAGHRRRRGPRARCSSTSTRPTSATPSPGWSRGPRCRRTRRCPRPARRCRRCCSCRGRCTASATSSTRCRRRCAWRAPRCRCGSRWPAGARTCSWSSATAGRPPATCSAGSTSR